MTIVNALIESTMLGYEDHGILTCWLTLDYDGSAHQGFGGYGLDNPPPKNKKGDYGFDRTPTIFAGLWIQKILKVVGVESWEKISGHHIRVAREEGWNAKILGIGHIIKDIWFYPEKDLKPYLPKEDK